MRISNDGKPMMAEHEIEFIVKLINRNRLEKCLEWGSGNSTVYFGNTCPIIKKWLSIEHNGHYVKYLSDKINERFTTIMWEPDNEWYIDCVKHHGAIYDFILIDGLQREGCLDIAFSLIKRHGAIILHDSGRKEYEQMIRKYNGKIIFEGEKKLSDGGYAHRGIAIFTLDQLANK